VFFQPQRAEVATPGKFGLAYEAVRFASEDGTGLYGWFLPARGKAVGTVLFLHGNAENISTHIASVAWLPARDFNVFLFDYRGYGASGGTPTLAGAQQDIEAAMQVLLLRADIDRSRIIVFGQSLGGALAAYYVAHARSRDAIRALVIDSAFSSYRGIVREKLAATWLTWPLQWLPALSVDERFSPLPAMKLISPVALLVIQGDRDTIVPAHHAQRLYDAALDPKQLWIVPGAGHIQSLRDAAQQYRLVNYQRGVLSRGDKPSNPITQAPAHARSSLPVRRGPPWTSSDRG
jgi:fermentation-respiration switch protein FrsA (DUF1100 family)